MLTVLGLEIGIRNRKRAGKDMNEPIKVGSPPTRIEDYLKNFRWADDKYPVQTPLRDMVDEIVQVRTLESCLIFPTYVCARLTEVLLLMLCRK